MVHRIPLVKVNKLRQMYFTGGFSVTFVAKKLSLTRDTVRRYFSGFHKVHQEYPNRLKNMDYFKPLRDPYHKATEKYIELVSIIPGILERLQGKNLTGVAAYKVYKSIFPESYAYKGFKDNFFTWCEQNNVSRQRNYVFPPDDVKVLQQWRRSNDHQHWQIAVALLESAERRFVKDICAKVEANKKTILGWLSSYKKDGLKAFERTHVISEEKLKMIKEREDNLIHLLHQSPKIYKINRTSWRLQDLADIYQELYSLPINPTMVSVSLRKRGYKITKARELLTSPDPKYKEKFEAIQNILKNLGEKEKFFSIDEYGPFSVKMKGGRSYTLKDKPNTYPQTQKIKGCLILTAALELATNQVTHFYSLKKNSDEMIKLVDVLVAQYHDQEKLYLSWDAASWHASKHLNKHVEKLNSNEHRAKFNNPSVSLAPLPSSAQYLNVIESVFSGMCKAIIHNSNYQSMEECKLAINTYYATRNKHFIQNPRRAGKKIWGKELVEPVFDKANRCKTGNSLSTKQNN